MLRNADTLDSVVDPELLITGRVLFVYVKIQENSTKFSQKVLLLFS